MSSKRVDKDLTTKRSKNCYAITGQLNFEFMRKKPLGALIGFILLAIGLTSIILNMTGLQLAFMSFMKNFSEGLGFLIYLCLMLLGGVIMYLSLTSWRS